MRFACWINTATDTSSESVILIALPRQKWFLERPLYYVYKYIACLVSIVVGRAAWSYQTEVFSYLVFLSDFLALTARHLGKGCWKKLLCRDEVHVVSESLWCKLQVVRTVRADGPLGLPLAKKILQGLYKLRVPNALVWFFSQYINKPRRLRQHFDRCKLLYDKFTSGVPAEIERRYFKSHL
jgi:hypothetical protein